MNSPTQATNNVVISERHQNPGAITPTTNAPTEKFAWAAIIAILTTILFIALLAMQWMDLQALNMA